MIGRRAQRGLLLSLMGAMAMMSGCTRSGAVVTPTLPSSPATVVIPDIVLEYGREGGIAGFCDTLTVRVAEAYWESCTGLSAVVPVDEATGAVLIDYLQGYESFVEEGTEPAVGADRMTETIRFHGVGKGEASAEVRAELKLIATELMAEAMQAPPGE